jgi:dsRNA-specific ribonuclease
MDNYSPGWRRNLRSFEQRLSRRGEAAAWTGGRGKNSLPEEVKLSKTELLSMALSAIIGLLWQERGETQAAAALSRGWRGFIGSPTSYRRGDDLI